jgi:trans-aconitate methyltransferase
MEAGRRQFDLYRFRAMLEGVQLGWLIEVGAGCSEFPSFALNHVPGLVCDALDYSRWAMEYMRQIDPRVTWYVGDVFTWQPPTLYDYVLAGEIIEHMEEPATFVERLASFARPRGGMVRLTTLLPHLQSTDPYHLWEFDPADLDYFFRGAGLTCGWKEVGNYYVVTGFRS